MKWIKQIWNIEFPQKKKKAQNLVGNIRRFEKKSLGPAEDNNLQAQQNMDWTTERKIKLLKIDHEE